MKKKLKAVIEKYRTSPEFLEVNLVSVNQPGKTGNTMLHLAAVNEAVDDITALIRCGAHINAKGKFGETALHQASTRGLRKSVRRLLRWGADATIQDDFGDTALYQAELMGRTRIIRMLRYCRGRRRPSKWEGSSEARRA